MITTTMTTGQQWDAPNGWAPLQWMAPWLLSLSSKGTRSKNSRKLDFTE
ncbi:MAG: hypothetical protein IPJ13_01975 [Saprospiraceae bacterium]|nr:hypothetical protein [Saprospiraceae bacterium]